MPSEDRCELKCLSAIGKRNRSSLALKVSPLSIKPGVGPIESGVKFEIELECRGFDFIGFCFLNKLSQLKKHLKFL